VGSIRLEHTIQGRSVELTWCCHVCNHAWPVAVDERELTERRGDVRERRRVVRKDRREKR